MTQILADVAIPMFGIMWLPLIFLFIPICAIESWVLARSRKVPFVSVIKPVVKANFYSATVGFLATWTGLALFDIVVCVGLSLCGVSVQGPFFYFLWDLVFLGGTVEHYPELDWLALAAFMVIAYFVSVRFEKRSLKKNMPELTNDEALAISRKMNTWSYLFLACFWVVDLAVLAFTGKLLF